MTKFTIREATVTDAYAVLRNLSDISRDELIPLFGTWWNALSVVKALMREGRTVVLAGDDQPIALFGHSKGDQPNTRRTWFACTPEFFRGARTTLIARNYLKTLKNFYPGVAFDSYTTSQHPACFRWYSLLGYRYLGLQDGAACFRLYVEKDEKSDFQTAS